MSMKSLIIAAMSFLFFLCSDAWGTETPSFPPVKIGGKVVVNGNQITGEQGKDYHFFVTRPDGSRFIASIDANDTGEDTDGFNSSDLYEIYIPTSEPVVQPNGAEDGEIAVIHVVYKDVPEYEYIVKEPDGGQFVIDTNKPITRIDLDLEGPPVLYVSPSSQNVHWKEDDLSFDVIWLGPGTIHWEASVSEDWLEITSGSHGENSGTITVSCGENSGEMREGTIIIKNVDEPAAKNSVIIVSQAAIVKQMCKGYGDVNGDEAIGLEDVILMLEVLTGAKNDSDIIRHSCGSVGLKEVIYALGILSSH